MKNQKLAKEEHLARAKANNLHTSTKHSVEICRYLRYKTTNIAKKILENIINKKTPIPFKRFKRNVGHRPGMAAGRFPQKAAKEVLKLIKAVETNAQFKGLNTSNLKITKILANKASIPMTGGRRRDSTKRTNLEVEVMEKKEKKKKEEIKKETPTEKAKPETKEEKPKLSSGSEKGLEKSGTHTTKGSVSQPTTSQREKEAKTEIKQEVKEEPKIEEKKTEEVKIQEPKTEMGEPEK